MTEPTTPPTPPSSSSRSEPGSNRNLMIVLAYLWILVLVPLLIEERDREVQWHAKHGLVLMAVEFAFWIVFQVGVFVTGGLVLLLTPFAFLAYLGFIVLRIVCIVQGVNGRRVQVPVLTPMVDRF